MAAGRLRPVLKLAESCNLSCTYCYQEGRLGSGRFMDEATLDRVLAELAANTAGPMHLLWFGGEPTLTGRKRFADALERAGRAFAGRPLFHGLQTNATLIDDAWAELLAEHRFAVTASLDGPAWLHDAQRPGRKGGGSHAATMAGVRALQARGVTPRVSAVITPRSLPHAEELVDWFADSGVPEVDFVPSTRFVGNGFEVEVGTEAYAAFLLRVMRRWLDLGRSDFRVRFFAELARKMAGLQAHYCKLEGICSHYVSFGWNGDVYPCDEFSGVPGYRLGNIHEAPLADLMGSATAREHFREWGGVPKACGDCRWLQLCRGGCPWERKLSGSLDNPTIMCEALKIVYDRMADEIPGARERWGAHA